MVTLNRNITQLEADLDEGAAANENIAAAIAAHTAATDPHPQYQGLSEANTAITSAITAHAEAADPHPQYQTLSEASAAITSAITAHAEATDPHPQYQTSSETDAAISILQGKKDAARYALYSGLSIVSSAKQSLTGPAATNIASGTYGNSRTIHKNLTGKPITHIAPVYAQVGFASGSEAAMPNQISVISAIEDVSSNGYTVQDMPRQPVENISGQNSVYTPFVLDRRSVMQAKPMPHSLAVNGEFYIRTAVTPTTGTGSYPRGGCHYGGTSGWGTNNGEGTASGIALVADGASAISQNASIYMFSEICVLGKTADGSIATSVGITGDSITDGIDDAGKGSSYAGGLAVTRLFENVPGVKLSSPGERLSQIVSANGFTNGFYTRQQLLAYATHVTCGYGRNDVEQYLTYGGDVAGALALYKTNLLTYAKLCMSQGKHFAAKTILPSPASTDGWFTTTNQTPQSGDKEVLRVAINAWITDTSASGFVAQANAQVTSFVFPGTAHVIDRCAPIECNQAGVLTVGGGCILGSQSGVLASGTATSATATAVGLTGAAWTVNAFKGAALYIESGTGAGQIKCIATNTATAITVNNSFSPAPDTTSVFKVYRALGMNGVHPFTTMHDLVSADVTVQAKVTAFLNA